MQEIELKFQMPAGALATVRAQLQASAGVQTLRLQAAYVDTPERHLARARAALRLRREGTRWVQTLKAQGADLMTRLEHNAAIAGAEGSQRPPLDLARHAGTPAAAALATALGLDEARFARRIAEGDTLGLAVVFETDLQRTQARRTDHGALLEWALDEGEVRAAGRTLPVCELELEHCSGPVAGLIAQADALVQAQGLWLDSRSKAERGEALARHPQALSQAVPAVPVRPDGADWHAALGRVLQPVVANGSVLADEAQQPQALAEHLRHWHRGLGQLQQLLAAAAQPATLGLPGARPAGFQPVWAEAMTALLAPLDAGAGPSVATAGRVMRSVAWNRLLLALLGWARG